MSTSKANNMGPLIILVNTAQSKSNAGATTLCDYTDSWLTKADAFPPSIDVVLGPVCLAERSNLLEGTAVER